MLRADTPGVLPSVRRVDPDHDEHRVRHPAPGVLDVDRLAAPACLVTHAARSGAHCWALLAWLSASASAKPQEDTLRAQPQPRYTLDNVAPVEPRSVARSLPVAAAVSVREPLNGLARIRG
jgi:hypothetical protein